MIFLSKLPIYHLYIEFWRQNPNKKHKVLLVMEREFTSLQTLVTVRNALEKLFGVD